MKVSEGNLPDVDGAEGDAATEVPGGRLLKGTLEDSSQDGVGIRQPSAPAGLPSSSCAGGGMVEGVGKGHEQDEQDQEPLRWVKHLSRTAGRAYYYNQVTGVPTFDHPMMSS